MKFYYTRIDEVFNICHDYINEIIIENQGLFSDICEDIYQQIEGNDGQSIVSIDNVPIDIRKNVELITQFVPFELNKKGLLNKVISRAEKMAIEPDYYEITMTELANIEKFMWKITENMGGNFVYSKLSIGNVIKSLGIEFEDDEKNLCEKILDYMELVKEYDNDKLFVFVNLRSYISDNDCIRLYDTILRKQFNTLMIENCEHEVCPTEKRIIVDKDNCVIK